MVLDLLSSGVSVQEIIGDHPGLVEADVMACIAYGAEMSRERYVDLPLHQPA
jgi:uncharacterized protein (DUF433 family)